MSLCFVHGNQDEIKYAIYLCANLIYNCLNLLAECLFECLYYFSSINFLLRMSGWMSLDFFTFVHFTRNHFYDTRTFNFCIWRIFIKSGTFVSMKIIITILTCAILVLIWLSEMKVGYYPLMVFQALRITIF